MTDKNLTEIIVIADRSSSMENMWDEAISGFNGFLKEQQESKDGRCLLTYTQFNTLYEIVHSGIPIEDMEPLTRDTYRPQGMTALLDAMGRTITEVGDRLSKTPEEKRPGNVVVVVLTDGEENSSDEYSVHKGGTERIKAMIQHQTEVYDWSFIFLAQNIDAVATGMKLGLDVNNPKVFVAKAADGGHGHQAAYFVASCAVSARREKSAKGLNMDFTDGEKAAFTASLTDSTTDSSSS